MLYQHSSFLSTIPRSRICIGWKIEAALKVQMDASFAG
jgi:hypothetical protein